MIPPIRTDPVWGRAQYGPVQLLGGTGPSPRLAVCDWTGLVWTSPRTLAILTLFLSQVPLKAWLILTFITAHLWIPTLGEIMTVLTVYLVPSRYIPPIDRLIQWKNTLNQDTVLDWSKSVQARSVQVQKKWGFVRSRPKNFSDWIGLDLDGPGLDRSNAGLVESLVTSVSKRHADQAGPAAKSETCIWKAYAAKSLAAGRAITATLRSGRPRFWRPALAVARLGRAA